MDAIDLRRADDYSSRVPPFHSRPSGASIPMSDATPAPAPEPAFDPARPLGRLALSMSGGGYRAAAFHLGMLRLLDRVGLLPSVVGLSTVSGGTICGMAWTASRIDGKSFGEFYDAFSGWMLRTNVIAGAVENLTGGRDQGAAAWASLIRAAADVYARPDLFGDRRFAEVLGARGLQMDELIFNSTEFHTGLDFRFRASRSPRALLGNRNYRLPRAVAQHVRLADIVAASSCFPGGFEPLVFPQQFRWSEHYPLDAALNDLGPAYEGGLPLMDGGVYDNQGVQSLVLAFRESDATTLVMSDVSTRDSEMYDVPPVPATHGRLTLRGAFWIGRGLFVLALASALVLAWQGWDTFRQGTWFWEDYLLYFVPGLLSAGVAGALLYLRLRLGQANRLLEKTVDVRAWPSFSHLTIPEFTQMLVLRFGSLLALTSKIFMARIRRLVFGRVYDDSEFKGRRIANLIYELATDHPALFEANPWLRPGPPLVELAQSAEQMPTTLWFDDETQFRTVETAGEATVCFGLLRHIVEDHAGRYEAEGTPLHDLFTRLRAEWDVFNGSEVRLPRPAPRQAPAASLWGAA